MSQRKLPLVKALICTAIALCTSTLGVALVAVFWAALGAIDIYDPDATSALLRQIAMGVVCFIPANLVTAIIQVRRVAKPTDASDTQRAIPLSNIAAGLTLVNGGLLYLVELLRWGNDEVGGAMITYTVLFLAVCISIGNLIAWAVMSPSSTVLLRRWFDNRQP